LSYCQLVKVINNDTVVILPIQEAKNINVIFLKLKDSIASYKFDNERIIDDFTKYQIQKNKQTYKHIDNIDSLKNKLKTDSIYFHKDIKSLKSENKLLRTFFLIPYVVLVFTAIVGL
jgi:hypothetical protein